MIYRILSIPRRIELRLWLREAMGAHFLALAYLLSVSSPASAEPPKLSCDEVRQAQLEREPGLLIIDVRPPADYAAGHIQGAKNVSVSDIGSITVPREGKVVVYCPDPACPAKPSSRS